MNTNTAEEQLEDFEQDEKTENSIMDLISERQTDELVFAFCGAVGSGVTEVTKILKEIVPNYKYQVEKVNVSALINTYSDNTDFKLKIKQYKENGNEHIRTKALQQEGNRLRKEYGNDYLAQLIIQEISIKRDQKSEEEYKPRRHITIIDSLKHQDEVKLLKAVYNSMFFLFGVLCPEPTRRTRLIGKKRINESDAIDLIDRDKSDDLDHGQQLLKTIQHADFFIRNVSSNSDILEKPLKRFITLILGENNITPTKEEYAMYCAQSSAYKSACISRQVGAAIVNETGEIIATGFNDVPKFGGGLYCTDDDKDDRCINKVGHECINDRHKKEIFDEIRAKLTDKIKDKNELDVTMKDISSIGRLKNLTEFSRSIHAEMDAITTVARNGKETLKKASLYCTTYPCHNCARHILAAGIQKVFYIEPYEKSLAITLHGEEIINGTHAEKLSIIPFEGVAPKQYMNLFRSEKRKREGKKISLDLRKKKPIVKQFLDRYIDYEDNVVKNLLNMKKTT